MSYYLPNRRDTLNYGHIVAIINVINYYIDKPDIVKQLRAADPNDPTMEGYIYEAMRKAIPTRVWRCANNSHCIGIVPPSVVSIVSDFILHIARLLTFV